MSSELVTRRDFIKIVGVGAAAFSSGALTFGALSKPGEKPRPEPTPYMWARFLAGTSDAALNMLISGIDGTITRYRIREVIPVSGNMPPNLSQMSNMVRLETMIAPPFAHDPSIMQFHGVRQNLHYTSEEERQELDRRSRKEVEPSDHTTAVLIPIGKSDAWWKLAQDQRQAYFQKTGRSEGHTAIGIKYVDRVFRRLYHSRYLNAALGYDFLTYFEFDSAYDKDFKDLLAELRDLNTNPEWSYVNLEYEIWMTKIA
jgi:hypothetical protein